MQFTLKRLAHSALASAALSVLALDVQAEMILNRGNGSEIETLDPAKSTGVPESNIQYELFEGLTTFAADGTLVPGIAKSWDVVDDGKTYVFHLRSDAKWSNGDPVRAGDFLYSMRRLVDPATASDYAPIADVIVNADKIRKGEEKDVSQLGVTAIDDHTLKISLYQPTPYLLALLRHSSFLPVPRAAIEKYGKDWTKPENLISNGAFVLRERVPQASITLVKNPEFHDAANVQLDKIIYYPTEDIGEEFKRFRAGELHITYDVPSDQINWIEANLKDEYQAKAYLGTYYYVINLTREPLGKSGDLRRALAMAIDRETIAEKVTQGSFLPAYSLVPPGTPNYETQYVDFWNWTREKRLATAKELLASAGYGPSNPLRLEILYNTNENHKKIAIAVQNMWKALGVEATLTNQEWQVYLDNRDQKAFDVARAGWIGDYADPITFLDIFLSDAGPRNDAGYNNPQYDALVKASAGVPDPAQRMKNLQRAEQIHLADLPVIPILHYKTKHLVSKKAHGWEYNNLDFHLSRYMWID